MGSSSQGLETRRLSSYGSSRSNVYRPTVAPPFLLRRVPAPVRVGRGAEAVDDVAALLRPLPRQRAKL
jgi:hypothetical protein